MHMINNISRNRHKKWQETYFVPWKTQNVVENVQGIYRLNGEVNLTSETNGIYTNFHLLHNRKRAHTHE